ncbi:MAG: hypothetical protein IK117_00625 [Bacteroidales bacterium]|nr:hypothetical protein [Bacteroidales bacterium]
MELEENAVLKELQNIFLSDNEENIHDAISYIHENCSMKMVPLLFDLLRSNKDKNIQKDIYNCLMDAKDAQAIPLFIDALKDEQLINEKKHLLSTIWQTNLDFSKHIDIFIDILLRDTYENALEAFTIIEVCSEKLSDEDKNRCRNTISNAIQNEKSEKHALLQAAIDVLQ